tara:strand:+ start:250 stop:681 length:432 start_codon:yes stop_codon:yes gene_type:complete
MRIFRTLFFIFSLTFVSGVFADSGRDLVERGLAAYSKEGARAAIEVWIKGSGLEGSKDALSQANVLRQVEDFYGNYEGHDIIDEHEISPRSSMISLAINYNKGVLFARFQIYKTSNSSWVATEFKFATEAVQLFPNSVVFGDT